MITQVYPLQCIATKSVITGEHNGIFVPIYKDLEQDIGIIRMVYSTSCLPGQVKGPHLHKKRKGHLTVLRGNVVFVIEQVVDNKKIYEEVFISDMSPKLVVVPPNTVNAHVNIGKEEAIVLNLCTEHCWAANDTDNYSFNNFDGYDVYQWAREQLK